MWSVPRCRGVRDARHVEQRKDGAVGGEWRAGARELRRLSGQRRGTCLVVGEAGEDNLTLTFM